MRADTAQRVEDPSRSRGRRGDLDPVTDLRFAHDDGRTERLGWIRAAIVCFVVAFAAGLVASACVVMFRAVERSADPELEAAGAPSSPLAKDAVLPPPAAAAAEPAAPVQAPQSAKPQPAPAVPATGRAAAGDRSLSFVVGAAQLRAGADVRISVSGTGPDSDHVRRIDIMTADGVSLAVGEAPDCTGPAFPWSQEFTIAFPQAEATELRVQLMTCAGSLLTATSLVDIQP